MRMLVRLIYTFGLRYGIVIWLKKNFSTKSLTVTLPGYSQKIAIRVGEKDWDVFQQVFVWKEYDYPLKIEPRTILDAGANVGYAALWFANKYEKAEIISLEPELGNFNLLKRNSLKCKRITPIHAGIWWKSCFLKVIPTAMGSWGFRTEEINSALDGCKALSIVEIMNDNNWDTIDLLKVDIEGGEASLFKRDYIGWLGKVKVLMIELHDNIDRRCSKSVFAALAGYNFSMDVAGENLVFINNDLIT